MKSRPKIKDLSAFSSNSGFRSTYSVATTSSMNSVNSQYLHTSSNRRLSRTPSSQRDLNSRGSLRPETSGSRIRNFRTIQRNSVKLEAVAVLETIESSSDSESEMTKEALRLKKLKRRQGIRIKRKKNMFNYQNIVAMPAPNSSNVNDLEETGMKGERSSKTKVESWWSADEYNVLAKKIKERQRSLKVNTAGSRRVIPAEKKYQPRQYKVCFIDINSNKVYNAG
jgi:hypothetical protein